MTEMIFNTNKLLRFFVHVEFHCVILLSDNLVYAKLQRHRGIRRGSIAC